MIVADIQNTRVPKKAHIGNFFALPNGDYYPFGKEARGSSTVNEPKEGFTGYQYEAESSLNYAGARYYNADVGRFISVDPLNQFASGYVYCSNNPVAVVDPTGLEAVHSAQAIKNFDNKISDWQMGISRIGGSGASNSLEIQDPTRIVGPDFQTLDNNYPKDEWRNGAWGPAHPVRRFKKWLDENFSCGLRMSLAFKRSGIDLKKYEELDKENHSNLVMSDAGEGPLLMRAKDFIKVNNEIYNNVVSFSSHTEFLNSQYAQKTGIVFMRANSKEGTPDHIDLWDGRKNVENRGWDNTKSGFYATSEFLFWEVK